MRVRLINLLDRPVTLYDRDLPVLTLPAAPRPVQAMRVGNLGEEIDAEGLRLTLVTHRYQMIGLPRERSRALLLVPRSVADLVPYREDLVYPHGPVLDDQGNILGYRGLACRGGHELVLHAPQAEAEPAAATA